MILKFSFTLRHLPNQNGEGNDNYKLIHSAAIINCFSASLQRRPEIACPRCTTVVKKQRTLQPQPALVEALLWLREEIALSIPQSPHCQASGSAAAAESSFLSPTPLDPSEATSATAVS